MFNNEMRSIVDNSSNIWNNNSMYSSLLSRDIEHRSAPQINSIEPWKRVPRGFNPLILRRCRSRPCDDVNEFVTPSWITSNDDMSDCMAQYLVVGSSLRTPLCSHQQQHHQPYQQRGIYSGYSEPSLHTSLLHRETVAQNNTGENNINVRKRFHFTAD
jgi:hypothetical protein